MTLKKHDLVIIGAGVVVTGLVWYFLSRKSSQTANQFDLSNSATSKIGVGIGAGVTQTALSGFEGVGVGLGDWANHLYETYWGGSPETVQLVNPNAPQYNPNN